MTPTPQDSTKSNSLVVAFIFALFAAFVTPVVLEYSTWRWYVCGGFIVGAVLILYIQRKIVRHEIARRIVADPRRSARGRRIISGVGTLVIGIVVALLLRDPSVDKKMLRFLIGFLFTCVATFASTFVDISRDAPGDEKA